MIDWREPPPKRWNYLRWTLKLKPVMERPGQWAVVKVCTTPGYARNLAYQLRRRQRIIPPGEWEFRSAGLEVFARYLGPQ